jgi:hypothetical protein
MQPAQYVLREIHRKAGCIPDLNFLLCISYNYSGEKERYYNTSAGKRTHLGMIKFYARD